MTLVSTSFHSVSGCKGRLSFSQEELDSGRFSGQTELAIPENNEGPVRFAVEEIEDIYIAPYEVTVGPESQGQEMSVRITGTDPYFTFSPDQANFGNEFPIYRFELPDLTTVKYCLRFLEDGLTDRLISEIRGTYDTRRSPFYGFIREAKNCLTYPAYIRLLAASAATDYQVQWDLEEDRHGFVKNLIRGRKAGRQFPIRDYSEFNSRTAEYDAHEELDPLDRVQIIERLLDDASAHDTHIDDICGLKRTFVEVADRLSTGFFVNLVSEALLTDFSIGTVTKTFENSLQIDTQDLVRHRFDDWEVSARYDDLREQAYDTHEIEDWERALAAVNITETSTFHGALADLLYWYTETTNAIPDGIKPQVYAATEALYEATGNGYMRDAAAFRARLTEGTHQRQNGSYENARVEFLQAKSISSGRDGPPFDEVKAFVESVFTDIAEYREQGEFSEGAGKAAYGYAELTEGDYEGSDTEYYETLLTAWEHDLEAQQQRSNGQFEEAINTTNDAIAEFRRIGEEGLAQTAQTRRYQIQAIMAQLEPDFAEARYHHRNALAEATSGKTAHLHDSEADLCVVKKHFLEEDIEEAKERLCECDQNEPTVSNLGVLIDVYHDYERDTVTPTDELIERLDTTREESPQIGRHISYHGNYVSAVILVASAQRLKQQNVPTSILDHITRVSIKNAISGGMTREWSEVTELTQINAENIWRQLIPSVILKDIEYVEILARQPHPNYAAQGMKLLAALEGYLRVLVEYHAKQEYGELWREEVISAPDISLGDIYQFFASDVAAKRIGTADEIYVELDDVRYFGAESDIIDVRNELDHNDLNWLDEASFEELKNRVFQIMRWSVADCPVIARIDDVDEKHQIYFGSSRLQRHRLPRRIEISTRAELRKDESLYFPPLLDVESGIAQVEPESIEHCELQPKQITEERP
jgi:hypothetical protein